MRFLIVNRYTKQADYYLRIDDKEFPNKITLNASQELELDINVKTPASQTTKKKICRRMVTDS
ncbi:hypothetical protein V8Z71_24790, partial [Vibrio echinoideorum]